MNILDTAQEMADAKARIHELRALIGGHNVEINELRRKLARLIIAMNNLLGDEAIDLGGVDSRERRTRIDRSTLPRSIDGHMSVGQYLSENDIEVPDSSRAAMGRLGSAIARKYRAETGEKPKTILGDTAPVKAYTPAFLDEFFMGD